MGRGRGRLLGRSRATATPATDFVTGYSLPCLQATGADAPRGWSSRQLPFVSDGRATTRAGWCARDLRRRAFRRGCGWRWVWWCSQSCVLLGPQHRGPAPRSIPEGREKWFAEPATEAIIENHERRCQAMNGGGWFVECVSLLKKPLPRPSGDIASTRTLGIPPLAGTSASNQGATAATEAFFNRLACTTATVIIPMWYS